MTPAELAALLVTHAAGAIAFFAAHPLALMLTWWALSAAVTALARPAVRERLRESPVGARLLAFVLLCEAAGINLPALLQLGWHALRLALDSTRPKP